MVKELPVVWLPGAAYTGDIISLLNPVSLTIESILINQVVPGAQVIAIDWEKKVSQVLDAAGL